MVPDDGDQPFQKGNAGDDEAAAAEVAGAPKSVQIFICCHEIKDIECSRVFEIAADGSRKQLIFLENRTGIWSIEASGSLVKELLSSA
jgi:hypothetical protein